MNLIQRNSLAIFAITFMIVTLLSISYTYNIYAANENANPKSGFPKDKHPGKGNIDNKIKFAKIDPNVRISLPYFGDGWTSTQGNDGKLYMQFGDATGMDTACIPADLESGQTYSKDSNQCYETNGILNEEQFCRINDCENTCFTELCQWTPSGLVVLTGNPENFIQSGETIIHVPYGDRRIFEKYDKISSMLFVGDRLYGAMLYSDDRSSITITNGYLAYSDDKGKNWKIVEGIDWNGSSNFKTSSFIQLHNKDNFVYTMGVQNTINWIPTPTPQEVYLNRVDKNSIIDFSAYQFFSGLNESGEPIWSRDESDAKPLDGLESIIIGTSMYHEGLDRYLFLTGWDEFSEKPLKFEGGLYESKTPWGQWHKVDSFETGYVSSIIPKGFTNDHFYFTGASFIGDAAGYNLNVGKMNLQLNNNK